MSLTVEDGTGVSGAESYASVAFITAYWAARAHNALAATWAVAASTVANQEGAAREATAFLDATFGPFYRGRRAGFVQGLLFPRTGATDEQGYPLPDLPLCLQQAAAELSARALSAPLAADIDMGARVKSESVGPVSTEYFDAGTSAPKTSYGFVTDMLAPVLNGSQPGAAASNWNWA